jgi:ribose/xylose/arabinose/galactoside ABC-type transport system permease subunit
MSAEVADVAETGRAAITEPRTWTRLLRGHSQALGVLATLVALFLITGFNHHLFWGGDNLRVLAMNMSFIALAGVGMTFLIITGNIDLSIGSILGLTAVLSAMLSKVVGIPLAMLLGVMIGGGLGALNGLVVWNVSTSPLIITLGAMTLLRGVIFVVTGGQAVQDMPEGFTDLANANPAGVPMPVWVFLVVALIGFLILSFTTTGRHVYAIGGSVEASRAAGIRVRRIVIGAFVFNGLLVGLAGVLSASLYGSPDATFGNQFELQVITAVIVGGVSFAGGEGGVVRAMIGCALLQVVAGAVVSFGIDPNWANVVTGAILILAVSIDHVVHRQRERYQKTMAMRELARVTAERRRAPDPEAA